MNPNDIRIETERLLLRPPRIVDFDGFAELQGDADAARFIGGSVSRTEAWRRFLWQPGAWMVQGFGMFGVVEKVSGLWVGQIGPWKPEGWPGNEIGYSFHPRAWGKGYATEAGTAAIDWARSEEHTSELKTLMRISYAAFCLKKKKKIKNNETRKNDVKSQRSQLRQHT